MGKKDVYITHKGGESGPVKEKQTVPKAKGITRLGRSLYIGSRTGLWVTEAGYKVEYFLPTVQITIGIGKDHTATLIMDEEAFAAFQAGEEVSISTHKELTAK